MWFRDAFLTPETWRAGDGAGISGGHASPLDVLVDNVLV